MRKDGIFWVCMGLNMVLLLLLVMLKPLIHTLPPTAMYVIIKIQLISQILAGFYGLRVSIDKELFQFFAKVYIVLFVGYVILKIPALDYLNKYYIVVPTMFSPFPFVITWILNKAFYNHEDKKSN